MTLSLLVVTLLACNHEPTVFGEYGRPVTVAWRAPGSGAGRVSTDSEFVYFPGDANELTAVRAKTGAVAWRVPTRRAAPGEGTLGFGTAISGPVVVMVDLFLYAFDRTTGQMRWFFRGEGDANPANSNPASNDSIVFTGSGAGIVWALRATTGEVVWRTPLPLPYPAMAIHPLVSNDLVFIGYTEPGAGDRGAVAALDANTGVVRWIHDFVQYIEPHQDAGCYGNVVATESTVYAWIGRGDVIALDRETGAVRWHRRVTHGLAGTVRRPLALVRGVLVVGSTFGHLEGLDPATGEELWRRQLSDGSLNEPFVEDGSMVYVTIGGGHVAAVNPLTGSTPWSHGIGGRGTSLGLFGPGAVDRENYYVGGTEGLFAFRK